jgi:superfamily I DNA/RNA helicase/mRNA-degrading endonuclease RelE of RelBE toxin-antitoxin system
MEFRISDTFTSSLARLTNEEQKQVKTTVFDLQLDPTNPGLQFHRIDKSRDEHFWSVRAGRDIRVIVHKTNSSFLVCYVGHHDNAYDWAERRKIEEHPKTGAAQIVEVRELVKEILVPKFVEQQITPAAIKLLFKNVQDSDLLSYGVPAEWIADVKLATEDTLFDIAGHLPQEASEALLELATGGKPFRPLEIAKDKPFEHPDAKRRFSLVSTPEELQKALDAPWDKWTVFLHPDQRKLVEQISSGPFRVSGSAGTGKTIVALHRTVHLLKSTPESRVLLTTFSETLANALRVRLKKLLVGSPLLGDRVDIFAFNEVAQKLYSRLKNRKNIISQEALFSLIEAERKSFPEIQISTVYLASEWKDVVDAWEVKSWDDYKNAKRLGRRKRLSEVQKQKVWELFSNVRNSLHRDNSVTLDEAFNDLAQQAAQYKNPPYSNIVVDEAQDIGVSQLRLLAALGGNRENGLFFAGDLGQRIFQQPFSWKALGVEIKGRSKTLKVNYRTSHQIRISADALLPEEMSDVDQNKEDRLSTISVFDGVKPIVLSASDLSQEQDAVSKQLKYQIGLGVRPEEIGVFVRSENEIPRAMAAVKGADLESHLLNDHMNTQYNNVSVGSMNLAKGLEFKSVFVMACDDEIIPNQKRLEAAIDESDLEEIYQTERHLLYVACTRARDFLMVSGVEPSSEFLQDLGNQQT